MVNTEDSWAKYNLESTLAGWQETSNMRFNTQHRCKLRSLDPMPLPLTCAAMQSGNATAAALQGCAM